VSGIGASGGSEVAMCIVCSVDDVLGSVAQIGVGSG
jgi:hypothetical protein